MDGITPNVRSQTVGYIISKSAYLWRRPAALRFLDWRLGPLSIRTQPNWIGAFVFHTAMNRESPECLTSKRTCTLA